MAYPEMTQWVQAVVPKSNAMLTGVNLAASAAQYGAFAVHSPIALKRISLFVTTAVTADTTAPVVEFKRRPTSGSSSGAVSLGTLTIPQAAAVGKVYYKDIAYVKVNAGEDLSLEIKTQGASSGTAAGVGFFGFIFEPAPDADANQTNMVVSA